MKFCTKRDLYDQKKTTQEERAEIVAFCIEHGKDYGLTVKTYRVSYQQIYSWVRKYEENGVDGLTDRRGKAILQMKKDFVRKIRYYRQKSMIRK